MKQLLLVSAVLAGGSLVLPSVAFGHGGTYKGPGDTVPPGGGGGGGGGGPTSPGPAGPSTPGPSGPSTPGPAAPGTPGPGGAPGGGPAAPTTGGGGPPPADLTEWTFWWEFNKDPYINLKAAIHSGGVTTGSDDFFLGHGEQAQAKDSLRPSEAQIRQKVVPALLRALETETNNDIVTGALIALAKIGDEKSEGGDSPFEKVIKPFLADSNQEISETAAVALGILANDASVATLANLMRDTPDGRKLVGGKEIVFRTRAYAAYALGLIGARTASEEVRQDCVRILLDVLQSDKSGARDVKVACLVAIGLVKPQTLEAEVAEGAAALPHQSRAALVDALLAYLDEDKNEFLVRAHAPVTLARLLQDLAERDPDMYVAYKDKVCANFIKRSDKRSKEQREVVQSCVVALGLLGDNDSDPIDVEIRKSLAEKQTDQQAEYFANVAMAQVGGRMGKGVDPAGKGLDEVKKFLLKSLGGKNGESRAWAGVAIGVLGDLMNDNNQPIDRDMMSALRTSLADVKSPKETGAYAIATGILRDLESEALLLDKLKKSKEDEARGYCCVGLGLMNATAAIEEIEKIVRESKYRPELLKQAAIGLGLLGDKQLVEDLIGMLSESTNLSTQASISTALGFIGDARSIDPLVAMLQNKAITERARGFAAAALGIVADKEPLPWNSKISVDLNYRASTPTLNDQEGTGILNIL